MTAATPVHLHGLCRFVKHLLVHALSRGPHLSHVLPHDRDLAPITVGIFAEFFQNADGGEIGIFSQQRVIFSCGDPASCRAGNTGSLTAGCSAPALCGPFSNSSAVAWQWLAATSLPPPIISESPPTVPPSWSSPLLLVHPAKQLS